MFILKGLSSMLSSKFKKVSSEGFAHAFLLLFVVVVVGIVGVYYLVSSRADTISFSLIGTHPQAAQQPTSQGKRITALTVFNGKVYSGFGDYGANTGPIALTPFDPVTNSFASTPQFTQSSEMVATFRSWGGKLYTPSIDPGGPLNSTFSVATLTNGTLGWQEWGSSFQLPYKTPFIEHVFDVNTMNGSDIWVAGSAGSDAVAFRSTDNGANWTEAMRVKGDATYAYRFNGLAAYNGKMYLQAMKINSATNYVSSPESNSHVFNGTSWSNGPSLISGYALWHPTTFAGKLVSLGWPQSDMPYSMRLSVFNGSSTTAASTPGSLFDFYVDGSTLYALSSNGTVYSTTDLNTWSIQATTNINASSIAVGNGKIYLGTADSKLYSAIVNTTPPTSGSDGGGTTCQGKKCGGGGGSGGGGGTCHGKKCGTASPTSIEL
jgi:hypothetical protein